MSRSGEVDGAATQSAECVGIAEAPEPPTLEAAAGTGGSEPQPAAIQATSTSGHARQGTERFGKSGATVAWRSAGGEPTGAIVLEDRAYLVGQAGDQQPRAHQRKPHACVG